MTMKEHIPAVVLAGRPNVGKSTLFNRMTRGRRSITDPTPGVTRDCVEHEMTLGARRVRLVDTGGFKLARDGEIEEAVFRKTLAAIESAAVIVLMLEAGEITGEDEEFIMRLRRFAPKTIVVVNKTEGRRREGEAWNYLSFGFEQILFVSAEHGDNVGELCAEIERRLPADSADGTADSASCGSDEDLIKIAIIGKPNTGKSTLSNRLLGTDASIVSTVAGTTRDVVRGEFTYKGQKFLSLDTAGMRRKARVDEDIEYYSVNRAVKAIGEADLVILLLDATEGLTDQDKKIAALACEQGRGVIIALNKWDLMPDVKNALNAVIDRIRFLFGQMNYAPILPLSAIDGGGVDEILKTAVKMYRQLTRKIETATLNEALARWQEEYPPPSGPKTRFSIKYGVQTSTNPAAFAFFATRPHAVRGNYASYIENKIRKTLGFSLIPITIDWRGTRKKRRT
ncbi:MAG: ribosome biogenesis GTPase Der [Spirochaetaceae bacterium]|nr:ribosome biogenesis GTPase Der [Spirochaetaceae bacterium]